jgi:ABC-type uncharacterized transport system auxiliary subunit
VSSVRAALIAAGLSLALAAGCALTERSVPVEITYYTPENVHAARLTSGDLASGPLLRLGRVSGDTSLGQRIVFADGTYRVRYYDDRRWTERPTIYVRRALSRALFEGGGFRRALEADAPTLDVEVLSFEELKTPARHAAHVSLRVVLSTDRVLLEDTVAVSEPVARESFDDVVGALARALDEASEEVARRVRAAVTVK